MKKKENGREKENGKGREKAIGMEKGKRIMEREEKGEKKRK